MTLSDKLRKNGITLDGGGLSEIMIKFNTMLAINIAIVYNWPSSNLASTAVSFVKDKTGCQSIVHFALVYQFILFFHLSMGYIIAMTSSRKGGYNNSEPRTMTADSAMLRRVKATAENTLENMVIFLVAVVVMMGNESLSVDRKSDIEKWSVLFMIARTLYVPCYILDLDIFRTFTFMVGSFSCIAIMMVSV
jgi:uncharacterized MAPEG superfamily protein